MGGVITINSGIYMYTPSTRVFGFSLYIENNRKWNTKRCSIFILRKILDL